MARRTKVEAEKTRKRILASALSLFSAKGYEHVTFTDIAARLKLTKGAVYWHFKSKEALLTELVRLALEKFHRQLESLMPAGELTYLAVAKMMTRNAVQVVEDPRAVAFFRLMKCQIRWGDNSAAKIREGILPDLDRGPLQAFVMAIENDQRLGRARANVNAEQIATVSMAIWDGLVQARIDHFLKCELEKTLLESYQAIWNDLRRTKK